MKKLFPLVIITSLILISCGQKNLNNVIITADTPIESKNQAAKVCEPIMKYITCSIEKAPESGKAKLEAAYKDMQRKINYDEPAKIAQECNSMVRVLIDKADIAFKNGCFIEEPAYMKKEVPNAQTPPTPPAPAEKETVKQ